MDEPLLSLALIMRDAQEDIIPCLSSCAGAVDEMVICDTGSRDGSVAKAKKFLRQWTSQQPGRLGEVCRFRWRDDFAAAKNFALGRAHGRYVLLLDSDERLSGETRGNLRPMVEMLARGALPEGCALTGPALWQGTGGQAVDVVELWRRNVERDGSTYMLELYLAQMYMERKEFTKAAVHAAASLRESRPVHDRGAPWRTAANAWLEEEKRAGAAGETAARARARQELEKALRGAVEELPDWPDFPYIRSVCRWNEADAEEDRPGKEAALEEMERAAILAREFPQRHPDQFFAFAAMLPDMERNLEQMRRELMKF